MKYYSEKLNKLFDKKNELEEAEKSLAVKEQAEKEKRETRAARAKEVEEAYTNYQKLLKEFIKDYGYYHQTLKDNNSLSVFDIMFNHWPF